MGNKVDCKQEKFNDLQKRIMGLMIDVKEDCSEYQEYKTIIMNLITVSKEVNSIAIKNITGIGIETNNNDNC